MLTGLVQPLNRAVDGTEVEVSEVREASHLRHLGACLIHPEVGLTLRLLRPCIEASQAGDALRSLAAAQLVLQYVKVIEVQRPGRDGCVVDLCGLLTAPQGPPQLRG